MWNCFEIEFLFLKYWNLVNPQSLCRHWKSRLFHIGGSWNKQQYVSSAFIIGNLSIVFKLTVRSEHRCLCWLHVVRFQIVCCHCLHFVLLFTLYVNWFLSWYCCLNNIYLYCCIVIWRLLVFNVSLYCLNLKVIFHCV